MAKVRIPEEYKNGFKLFISLSNKDKDAVIKIIAEKPVSTKGSEFAIDISKKIKLDYSSVLEIVEAITSLSFARENVNGHNKFVQGVVEALEDPEYETSPKSLSELYKAFSTLFSVKSTYHITDKARALTFQRENLLLNTRVITDIRPIFSDDDDCQIEGEVILHTLKIASQKGYNHDTIYFALDSDDLAELKVQIERAERKESNIRKRIGNLPNKIL